MWTKLVFEVILLLIVGLIGIIGNILLIKSFLKIEEKLNFHLLMMTLAVYDTIYITLCALVFSIPEVFEDYRNNGNLLLIVPTALPIIQIALTGSVYCTVAISLERYLTVCHPFYLASKRWSAKRYIIPIIVFSLLYNASRFFELRTNCNLSNHQEIQNTTIYQNRNGKKNVASITDELENQTLGSVLEKTESINITFTEKSLLKNNWNPSCKVELTSLRKNQYYYSIYIIGLNFVFNGLIPLLLIIVMNIKLYLRLKSVARGRPVISQVLQFSTIHIQLHIEQHPRKSKHRNSSIARKKIKRIKPSEIMLAKVSFFIVFVFIICHSVRWIPNIYELIQRIQTQDGKIKWPSWIESLTQISHFLTVLNSSVNFYIFSATRYGLPDSLCKRRSSLRNEEGIEMSRIGIDQVTVTNESDLIETTHVRGDFV